MVETTPLLPGLSPGWAARPWSRFDGERRLDLAGRLPGCVDDPRDPSRTVHSVADILRFRMMMIAAGYEDGIDAKTFRTDPVFKMALERLPGERASARSHGQPAGEPVRPAHAVADGPRHGRALLCLLHPGPDADPPEPDFTHALRNQARPLGCMRPHSVPKPPPVGTFERSVVHDPGWLFRFSANSRRPSGMRTFDAASLPDQGRRRLCPTLLPLKTAGWSVLIRCSRFRAPVGRPPPGP
jgi:hypothetical protein